MYAAVDIGTSGVKAVMFDRAGGEVALERLPLAVDRPADGWAEQDMAAIWNAVCKVLQGVAKAAGSEPEFLAVTAQGDGCWLVDAAGKPVRPALLWNDARASGYVRQWVEDGTVARGYAINGSTSFPGLANAALRWLADHEPAALAASATLHSCGSWIFRQLTGEVVIELSDASAPFLDARRGGYSDELLTLYGLAGQRHLLPPVVDGPRAVYPLRAEAAMATGLPAGTPVVLAPYDVPSAALGAGAVAVGDAVLVLGTTFLCGVVTDVPVADRPAGATVALGVDSLFLRFFPTLSGMEVAEWAAHLLGVKDAPALVDLAFTARQGSGPQFLPYLSPAGERAPFLDPRARGTFFNLSLEHGPAELARAVVEGLTMALVDCLTAADTELRSLTVCGGGANSDAWCQLIADATGRALRRSASPELTAKGAALAGLVATGRCSAAEAAAQWRDAGRTWQPDADRHARYAEQYREFCRLRELARRSWHGDPATGGTTP